MDLTTYPEGNENIKAIFRMSDDPAKRYALARIEELEAQVKETEMARDVMTRRIPEGWTCRKSDKGFSVGGFTVPRRISDAMNLDDFYQPDPFSAWVYSDRWYAANIEASPKS